MYQSLWIGDWMGKPYPTYSQLIHWSILTFIMLWNRHSTNLAYNNLSNYLTAWSRVLFEKLIVPNLVKKFPTVCGAQGFINHVHCSPPLVPPGPYQASPCPPSTWCLKILPPMPGSSIGTLLHVSPPKSCMHISSPPFITHALPISFFFTLSPN